MLSLFLFNDVLCAIKYADKSYLANENKQHLIFPAVLWLIKTTLPLKETLAVNYCS